MCKGPFLFTFTAVPTKCFLKDEIFRLVTQAYSEKKKKKFRVIPTGVEPMTFLLVLLLSEESIFIIQAGFSTFLLIYPRDVLKFAVSSHLFFLEQRIKRNNKLNELRVQLCAVVQIFSMFKIFQTSLIFFCPVFI